MPVPPDAGQLLFGPLTQFLQEYGREKRGRQERESVRAEERRRYEEAKQREQQRYQERLAQRAHDLEWRASQSATPESLGLVGRELQRTRSMLPEGELSHEEQAILTEAGVRLSMAQPTMAPSPGMVPTGQGELLPMGPLYEEMGGRFGPPQELAGAHFDRPAEALPEYQMGQVGPTAPLAQAVFGRMQREEAEQLAARQLEAAKFQQALISQSLAPAPVERLRHATHVVDPQDLTLRLGKDEEIAGHESGLSSALEAERKRKERASRRQPGRPPKMTLKEFEKDLESGALEEAMGSLSRYKPESAKWTEKRKQSYVDKHLNRLVRTAMSRANAKKFKEHVRKERDALRSADRAYNKAKWHDPNKQTLFEAMNNARTALNSAVESLAESEAAGVPINPVLSPEQVRQLRATTPENRAAAITALRNRGYQIPAEFVE